MMTKGIALLLASLALCLSVIALMGKPANSATVDVQIINGAGAICRNGAISLSTGPGTCSHHGGVEEWLDGR